MSPRMNYYQHLPEAFSKLVDIGNILNSSLIDKKLQHLIKIRASQINGCAFCVDMHVKEATILEERELRLHHVAVWKESPLFTPREKAALAWTEAVTRLSPEAVSDPLYNELKNHFSDKEIVELTMVISLINMWNRFGVSFQAVPGSADKAFGLEKAGLN